MMGASSETPQEEGTFTGESGRSREHWQEEELNQGCQ